MQNLHTYKDNELGMINSDISDPVLQTLPI